MRVSQRTDYALRALVLLSLQHEGAVIAAGTLAQRLTLPRRFVEQQLSELARAGIVRSSRGAGGGYSLTRAAVDITVEQVVSALQGEVLDVPRVKGSSVSEMWSDAARSLSDALTSVTLADLADRQREIDAAAEPMYYI